MNIRYTNDPLFDKSNIFYFKINCKCVFYLKYYFYMNIKHTNDLLFDKSNIFYFSVIMM